MQRRFWAGYITPDVITQHANIDTWALHWLDKAKKAATAGNELIIFEVPKFDVLSCVEGVESVLQGVYSVTGSGFLSAVPQPPISDLE